LLKVLQIAGKQGEVMLKTRGGNEDIQITDLLPDHPWQAAPDLGKAFHDWLDEGKYSFPFEEGP
jgi:hypothetical protein